MEKHELFKIEESYIKNKNYIKDFHYLIDNLPDYFVEIPASSTGKYHPEYATGEGGLLRHTRAAVRIAKELLDDPVIGDKYTNDEKDLMLIALSIHDGLKSGWNHEKYTRADHPILVSNYIEDSKDKLSFTEEELDLLKKVVASHMGNWNTDYDGNEILPKPKTKYENFVHMCDYLASRKCLVLKFDRDNNIIG